MSVMSAEKEVSKTGEETAVEASSPAWDLEKNPASADASLKTETRPITGLRVSTIS